MDDIDFYDISCFMKEDLYHKKERILINEKIENNVKIMDYKDIVSFYDKLTNEYKFGVEIPFKLKLKNTN